MVVCGAFFAAGLAMAVGGLTNVFAGAGGGGMLLAAMGGLCAVIFGLPLLQGLRTLTSSGLRLTPTGFELNKHSYNWSDIEAFDVVGSHIRVRRVPGAAFGHDVKTSETLGRLGLYSGPTYIPRNSFDTGGQPMEDILRRWQQGDRTAGQPVAPTPDITASTPSAQPPAESLVIPLKRWPRVFVAISAVLWFVVVAGGIPWAIADADNPEVWLVIALGVIWLVIVAASGYGAYGALRALRVPELLLTDNGFTFDRHTWAWADIEDFENVLTRSSDGSNMMQFRVVFRADRPTPSPPADLPFGLTDFDTGGRPLGAI
ncbi:MAG: hypothetical protein QOD39_4420, partial [Mycobacterium sp.]|nr:hypothetical protein [Mycobacterium sp.]